MNERAAILLLITAFTAAVASLSKADSITDLEFEGAARQPIPFEPFVVKRSDGSVVSPSEKATLRLRAEELRERLDARARLEKELSDQGFTINASPVSDLDRSHELTAGDYVRALNEAERRLNELGYTLRSESDITAVERQVLNEAAMREQIETASEVYVDARSDGIRQPATDSEVAAGHRQARAEASRTTPEYLYLESQKDKCGAPWPGESKDAFALRCFLDNNVDTPTRLPSPVLVDAAKDRCDPETPLGRALLVNEMWSDAGGDENFGWSADAGFKLKTDAMGLTLEAKGTGEGRVLGHARTLIDAGASFTSPRSGVAHGGINLSILGKSLYNQSFSWDQSFASSRNEQGVEQYTFDKDVNIVTTTFVVGFVPVSLSVGAKVTSGVTYQVNLLPVKVVGRAELIERISVFASAGVGAQMELFEILVGAKGYVDLIDAAVGTFPEASLEVTPEHRPVINARVDARAAMRTLSGSLEVGVWAKSKFPVPQGKLGWPPVEMKPLSHSWKRRLADYPGYNFPSAVIFDYNLGYDICTGRKNVETVVAKQPRTRDTRLSYAMEELQRIRDYEAKVARTLDEHLQGERRWQVESNVGPVLEALSQLKDDLDAFNRDVLEDLEAI